MRRAAGLTGLPRCGNNAAVIHPHLRTRVFGAFALAAALCLAPGCTLLDEVLPGTPFTPDQPLAAVTVVGGINIDVAHGSKDGCSSGETLFWGVARNTGDLDVDDVYINIDALNSGGGVIGTYRTHVYNGEVTEVTPATETEPAVMAAGTSLTVDQSGTFSVCARVSVGAVAGTAYRTDFIVIDESK